MSSSVVNLPDTDLPDTDRPDTDRLDTEEHLADDVLLDRDSAAWVASLLVHLGLLGLLAAATLVLPGKANLLDLTLDPSEQLQDDTLAEEFLSSVELNDEMGQLGDSGDESALAAAPEFAEESLVILDTVEPVDFGEMPSMEVELEVFQGPEASDQWMVQGAGSVGTSGASGAIDRITHEILTSLEQRKTLVVWLFDQSGSLKDERIEIIGRFERIYDELGIIEAAGNPAFRRHVDKPLLTAVVGFGAQPELLTPEPTDQLAEVTAAVRAVGEDENDPLKGVENVFNAVAMAAEKYRRFQSIKNGRRNVMIVVFTDETGNDVDQLDATVDVCRKFAMPVYVIGRPAPFGRRSAYVKWIDPDPAFDQRPQWVPVDLGPETLLPERLKLNFAGRGGRDELLDSGFGPYALTRLCYETGGIYFSAHPNRAVGRNVSARETENLAAHFVKFFDANVMRRYQPDYVPVQEYIELVNSNQARRALVEAAEMSWTTPMENVRLRFPKRDEASLAQALSRAQQSAALLQPKIDRLCQTLLAGEPGREKLRQPRWQAGYDLAVGRALAVKARTDGYNAMLARAKQGMEFEKEKNNVWVLRAGNEFVDSSTEKLAAKATDYLERVQEEHPDTPWALLAREESAVPMGWQWRESYMKMSPPGAGAGGNNRPRPQPQMRQGPPRRNPPPL
ncbi:VWA domain-containing protein [Pirellulales bacterium]|nr:VWA domain-containing protein [Pirellulales bacterium]